MAFSQARRCATQLARAMWQPDDGNFCFLENHAQSAEYRVGAGRIIGQESNQALALLYIRLKSEDVHSTRRQREEALPQGARFVFNRNCELFRLRHMT